MDGVERIPPFEPSLENLLNITYSYQPLTHVLTDVVDMLQRQGVAINALMNTTQLLKEELTAASDRERQLTADLAALKQA